MKFLVLVLVRSSGVCTLESIRKVEDFHNFTLGVSMKDGFPEDASMVMDRESPKDLGLADALWNTSSLLVVSDKFKRILEGIPGALHDNEFLNVTIVNHKGRSVKDPYFIIHQLNNPPAVDEGKTQGRRSKLAPDTFQFVDKMVLDESKIPKDRMLFRVKQFSEVVFIRADLAQKLEPLGLTGFELREIDAHEWDA
jgi:hypothetical protein